MKCDEYKIEKILQLISQLQDNSINQATASEQVGQFLADEYIPKNLYKQPHNQD